MHGTEKPLSPLESAAKEGWTPYMPGILTFDNVTRQIGHKPTLYVMRRKEGRKSFYRDCTPQELAAIERRDLERY